MRKTICLVQILFMFLVYSCATMNVNMTPKQISAMMNSVYDSQYKEYLSWFNIIGTDDKGDPIYKLKPSTPQKQIEILQKKKEIFTELHPLLNAYAQYAATGKAGQGVLIDEVENRASSLVQELIKMDKEN